MARRSPPSPKRPVEPGSKHAPSRISPLRRRASGILLHPTSLPDSYGTGDLGPAAHRFAEFLARAGQSWWQMLPIGPLGGGNSPYDSPSSFAGNPLLIDLGWLRDRGWIRDLPRPPRDTPGRADYRAAARFRQPILRAAFEGFRARATCSERAAFDTFRDANAAWLADYALYTALQAVHRKTPWTEWEPGLRRRTAAALTEARRTLADRVEAIEFLQWVFDRQWNELRERCAALGVALLGDVPMYVKHEGVEVWSRPDLFDVDDRGRPRHVAGVPPDYFSEKGQLWGNPLYRWDALRKSGYAWWIARLAKTLERFDAVRIDHFIALHRFWEVPASAKTAQRGRFVPVPGEDFLSRLRDALGGLPFIAEDLGLVTPEVHALRERFDLPGMRVLEFAFSDAVSEYQPHRYPRDTVVYTGTHDNDTLIGWLRGPVPRSAERARAVRAERKRALDYAGSDGREPHWDLIRLALMSVAGLAIFPVQDLLGLGSEARMNVPGTPSGNWAWRLHSRSLTPELADRMASLCRRYERVPHRSGA